MQIKENQIDCAINMGMVTYLKRLKDQLKEENIAKTRKKFDKIKPDELVIAACRNAMCENSV